MSQGTLWDCTNEEYHAETEHVSSSSLKVFMDNPSAYYGVYVVKTWPRQEPTKAMIFGSLFHALALEGEVGWRVWDGPDRRTKIGKEAWSEFSSQAHGYEIITSDEQVKLYGMLSALERSKPAMALLETEHGTIERCVRWTHPSGIHCKCRWDKLCYSGVQCDLKVVAEPGPGFFRGRIKTFRYHCQAALYTQGLESLTGQKDGPFRFITICAEWPHNVHIYELPDWAIQLGHEQVNLGLREMARRRAENDWADPLALGVNVIDLSPFALNEGRNDCTHQHKHGPVGVAREDRPAVHEADCRQDVQGDIPQSPVPDSAVH